MNVCGGFTTQVLPEYVQNAAYWADAHNAEFPFALEHAKVVHVLTLHVPAEYVQYGEYCAEAHKAELPLAALHANVGHVVALTDAMITNNSAKHNCFMVADFWYI